jgi:hypothetical protein
MSAPSEATRPAGQKKTFGKSTREVPHHSQKAKKWYPAEDEVQPRKVCLWTLEDGEESCCNCGLVKVVFGPAVTKALPILKKLNQWHQRRRYETLY